MDTHAFQFSTQDLHRLLELLAGFARSGRWSAREAIERLELILNSPSPVKTAHTFLSPGRDNRTIRRFVEKLRRLRLRRNDMMGAPLFRDPAWDMLLDLFVAHERGQRLSISGLCHGSGVPLSTALRQVQRLEQHGFVTRTDDPEDCRRTWVEATPHAIATIGTMAAQFLAAATEVNNGRVAGVQAELAEPEISR